MAFFALVQLRRRLANNVHRLSFVGLLARRLPLQADTVMVGRAVPKQVRAVSLMIWFLSKSSDLGMAYVLSRGQEYDLGDVDLHSKASVALFMVSWLA